MSSRRRSCRHLAQSPAGSWVWTGGAGRGDCYAQMLAAAPQHRGRCSARTAPRDAQLRLIHFLSDRRPSFRRELTCTSHPHAPILTFAPLSRPEQRPVGCAHLPDHCQGRHRRWPAQQSRRARVPHVLRPMRPYRVLTSRQPRTAQCQVNEWGSTLTRSSRGV